MAEVEAVTSYDASLGEGPVWMDGRLYWIGITSGIVYSYDPESGREGKWDVGAMIGCFAPCEGGGIVAALETGFAFIHLATGAQMPIAHPESDRPENRFNDGKADPAGRFWAGTMERKGASGQGTLYMLDRDGTVKPRIRGTAISNGIAWSPDAGTMYYVDSPTHNVVAYDFDLATGDLANPRVLVSIPAGEGVPDGMTVDADGNLWIALWGGKAVVCHDPKDGKRLYTISTPVSQPSSVCFGGPELTDLYITSASQDLSPEQRAAEPLAGRVFRTKTNTRGMPARFFKPIGSLKQKLENLRTS